MKIRGRRKKTQELDGEWRLEWRCKCSNKVSFYFSIRASYVSDIVFGVESH